MMKKTNLVVVLCLLALCMLPLAASAQGQDPQLTLSLKRTYGYAGAGRIQGRFSATAKGPDNLLNVEFWIDGKLMGSAAEPPFRVAFSTGDYAEGRHTLYVTAEIASGTRLESEPVTVEFVSAETSWQEAMRLAGPILVGALILVVISSLVPALGGRHKTFELGAYGGAGGAVCRRCKMPFSRAVFAPNLFFGKLERCPHCGKWGIVARAGQDQLQAAEQRYLQDAHQGEVIRSKVDAQIKRQLEDSRFEE